MCVYVCLSECASCSGLDLGLECQCVEGKRQLLQGGSLVDAERWKSFSHRSVNAAMVYVFSSENFLVMRFWDKADNTNKPILRGQSMTDGQVGTLCMEIDVVALSRSRWQQMKDDDPWMSR